MSYSRPSYVPVNPGPESRLAHKYALYLFRETAMDKPNEPNGVPALFIPGHAGSYKQVRSIAATSTYYHKQNKPNGERIDFFTVDLNEGFSAMSGQLLYDQAEYLNDAVRRILSLYDPSKASSVLIVGHSMGGVVARLMQTLPNYRANTIKTILTLATPHTMPPIMLGPKMARVYEQIRFPSSENITLVSLAGGTSDSIVNSDAAILPKDAGMTAFSTAIPKVWTTCDHMAILWCNQLVRVVSAALIDSVQQQSKDVAPLKVFENYFIKSPLILPGLTVGNPLIVEAVDRIRLRSLNAPASSQLTVLPILEGGDAVFNLMSNDFHGRVRAVLCKDSKCTTDVTHKSVLVPSSTPADHHSAYRGNAFWFLELKNHQMQGYDSVGVWEQGDDDQTFVVAEMNTEATQVITESIWDMAIHGGISFELSPPQQPQPFFSTVQFPAIYNPLLAYKLTFWTQGQEDNSDDVGFAPIIQQNMGGESKFHVGLKQKNVSVEINFYASGEADSLQLRFWKLREVHNAHLQIDWYGSLGKSVLRYGPSIPTSMFIVALVVLINDDLHFARALINLVAFTSVGGLVFDVPQDFAFWWLPGVSLCLGAGALCLIWILVYSLVCLLRFVVPRQAALSLTRTTAQRLVIAVSLASIRAVPVPVTVTAIYLYWLLVVAAVESANASTDIDSKQKRKTILLFLSALLPYNVPEVVVYARDLIAVGWQTPIPSLASVMDDIPMLFIVLILVTMDSRSLSNHIVKFALYTAVVYYTLYGYQYPYPLHMFIQQCLSNLKL
ncbi:PGAP1-like protein-domain-containing protein [Zychaea mexicana]|uniref:PGAP1-like protein-domain-containing protein n=1 Tax=Zychaea mexicana TaxID=64656 RepID=UPI0022FDC1A7|nr:PGAP1-like protein-domain-containing protein [Zychaea mexicana]KAI9494900.1 PGAP1-like protein-domain-containing protein [Zychaea mexicana]